MIKKITNSNYVNNFFVKIYEKDYLWYSNIFQHSHKQNGELYTKKESDIFKVNVLV